MTESERENTTPPEQHPLYEEAVEHLANGQEEAAAENLRQLCDLYPAESSLREMLVRAELKISLASAKYTTSARRRPTPVLRQVLLILLTITLTLIGCTGTVALVQSWLGPIFAAEEEETHTQDLYQTAERLVEARAWQEAKAVYEQILDPNPADPVALAAMQYIDEQDSLDRLYVDALQQKRQGNPQQALDTLIRIRGQSPGFKDIDSLIEEIQAEIAIEERWQQIQATAQLGDWPAVATQLSQIRQQNPAYRRSDVEGLLFQAYREMANQQLQQANANPDELRQAIDFLDRALELRPADRALQQERTWARAFVAGSDYYAAGDPIEAVAKWEPIYSSHPDYQGGVLHTKMRQAYPEAARALIATADGGLVRLSQAVDYLDKALGFSPGDETLLEERRLASAYVAGAEAFKAEEWDTAIAFWGPIYAIRSDYQNGVLRDNLSQACVGSDSPDQSFCSP